MSVQMKMEDVNITALIRMVLTIAHVLLDTGCTRKNFVQVIKIKFLNWLLLVELYPSLFL